MDVSFGEFFIGDWQAGEKQLLARAGGHYHTARVRMTTLQGEARGSDESARCGRANAPERCVEVADF
jgi:hypothetical protein